VTLTAARATTPVSCGSGVGACRGQATLSAVKTQRINGHVVKKGALLAQATYKIKAGHKTVVKMKKTSLGKNVLGAKSLTKAKLRIGGKVRTVHLKF
jgi:hypothetical protein